MTRRLLGVAVTFLASVAMASAVDTTIKGDRMELIDKGKSVLFSGGVTLDRGTDRLVASEMKTNQRRDKVYVKGDVRLTRIASATDTWKAWGQSGFYDTGTGEGHLIGAKKRARLERTEVFPSTGTRTTDIYADRIDFARDGRRARAQGNVYGRTVDPATGDVFEFRSEVAEHLGDEGRLTLSGAVKPVITQTTAKGTREITGKTIIYYSRTRKLVSKDGAQAVMREKKKEK